MPHSPCKARRSYPTRARFLLPAICLAIILVLLPGTIRAMAQQGWLMKAHDARRTGQSTINGPASVAEVFVTEAPGGFLINQGATVTPSGAFYGSWGVLRNDSLGRDVRFWQKYDGKLYGVRPGSNSLLWGGPLDLDIAHRCYAFEGRARTGDDLLWCGISPYHVSFFNGTVEGQPAFDAARSVLYLGRGDGKLYAIDPDAGEILWRFTTFNPIEPTDPDGGGEVISAPLLGPDGTVYFGTWGVGAYETNAMYAVSPDGTLRWRFPSDSSLASQPIFAAPALSPDGSTAYFATFFAGDTSAPGVLYAMNISTPGPIPDAQRLRWSLPLRVNAQSFWSTTLAVGTDGTVYVGGLGIDASRRTNLPILAAVKAQGAVPAYAWPGGFLPLRDGAEWIGGVALREIDGATTRLFVTTANFRPGPLLPNQKDEGSIHAVDPATGGLLGSYSPSEDVPVAVGSLNSPAIGADGTIYFGVRGKFKTNTVDAVNGHVFAVSYDAASATFAKVWNFEVEGHMEWSHPAIGPDGGIYVGSSEGAFTDLNTYAQGEVPPNAMCRLYALRGSSTTRVADDAPTLPRSALLVRNYPNPFNPETAITYALAGPAKVTLRIFDLRGKLVRIVLNEKSAGSGVHRHTVDLAGAASGIYIYELRVNDTDGSVRRRGKMALIR